MPPLQTTQSAPPFRAFVYLANPRVQIPHCRPVKPAGHILAARVEMSALEELVHPCDGDEFDDIDALLHALDN